MAAPIDFNALEWVHFYARYRKTPVAQRGALIREATKQFGTSKSVIYKRIKQVESGHDVFGVAKGKVKRKRSAAQQALDKRRDRICRLIAVHREATRIGKKGYAAGVEAIVEVLLKEGKLQQYELPDPSTLRRWMKQRGLAGHEFRKRQLPARSFIATRRNECWFVDATPLNKYHLHLDGSIETINLELADKHREELLRRRSLQKIITFYVVDLFSGAYWLQAYPVDGESSAIWRRFLTEAMMPKENYPLEGIPEIFYTDMGSGLKANDTLSLFGRLGTKLVMHEPGNPSAKGSVEGRISAFKRSRETLLNLLGDKLNSIDLLNSYLVESARRHCDISGRFRRYLSDATPLRTIDEKGMQDLLTIRRERTISAYGTISVKWPGEEERSEYFVENGPIGAKVGVFRSADGRVVAQLLKSPFSIFSCDPRGRHKVRVGSFETLDGRSIAHDAEGNRLRRDILKEAARIPGTISADSIFPPTSNMIHLRPKGQKVQTHSLASRDRFDSVDEALSFIHIETGYKFGEFPEEISKALSDRLSSECTLRGHIPFVVVQEISNILRSPEAADEISK